MASSGAQSATQRGRKYPAIITENFIVLAHVENKSNRKWWKCVHCADDSSFGARIEGRDNNLLNHLANPKRCPNAPGRVQNLARVALAAKGQPKAGVPLPDETSHPTATSESATSPTAEPSQNPSDTSNKRKRANTTSLEQFFDYPLTPEQEKRANIKLFRALVHANVPFRLAENWYFTDFLNDLRPSYDVPSPYVLTHTVMDSEYSDVQLKETQELEARSNQTYLFDGWEDMLKRSLYGSVAAHVKQPSIVLGLEDLTGKRGDVDTLIKTTENAAAGMGLGDMKKFIAVTTDNPTTMRAFRRELQKKYWWLLLFACFLHGINTIIGEISIFKDMKPIITQATQIVTFFNNSHYWGGQLREEARRKGISTSLKPNCESRWYALVLHCMSVLTYRDALAAICIRRDAQKSVKGLSIIPERIRQTVLANDRFWTMLNQFVRTTKPLVDAIGNLETRQATLADCMLELIRCARTLTQLKLDVGEDCGFWMNTKLVFNRRFHEMDTSRHSLALFCHPLCRKLAISQVANGRSLDYMKEAALEIAKQWRWSKAKATALSNDIDLYYQGKKPFIGGHADALEWWESLSCNSNEHPLKTLAIVLHSVVPHAAEIERLFSDLGGTQSARRCRLSVETIEKLGKLRSYYARSLRKKELSEGKPAHRRHAHMHTRAEGGINTELATDLEETFAWIPPINPIGSTSTTDDSLDGPESLSIADLDHALEEFEKELQAERTPESQPPDGEEVLQGKVYDFTELEKVDQGIIPEALRDDIQVLGDGAGADDDWDVDSLLRKGL